MHFLFTHLLAPSLVIPLYILSFSARDWSKEDVCGTYVIVSQTFSTCSSPSSSSMSTCSPNPLTPPSLTDCRVRPTPVALQTPSEGETRSQLVIERSKHCLFASDLLLIGPSFIEVDRCSGETNHLSFMEKGLGRIHSQDFVLCPMCILRCCFKLQAPARLLLHTSHKKTFIGQFWGDSEYN